MTIHPIEVIRPRNLAYLYKNIIVLVSTRLWLKVVVGMLLGALVGYLLNPATALVSTDTANIISSWVALPGRMFLTIVQMIVVPLVFASVIRGIAANNSIDQLKGNGLRLVVYFLTTTAIAALIGVMLASFIQPGHYVDTSAVGGAQVADNIESQLSDTNTGPTGLEAIPQAIVSILPNNPFSDAAQANMLQIVLFSIIVGLALITMRPQQSQPLLDLTGSILEVSMTIVRWVMVLAPYAVFGLIAQLVIETGLQSFVAIGVFVISVLAGLFVLLLCYLATAYAFGGWGPFRFLTQIRETMLLAFSTDSSAATMPLSLKTVEEKLRVRPSIAQFVIPLGATVNMNATALFQGMATIFFIQVYGLDVSIGTIAVLVVTIIGSSIGAPATPGVGIVVLSVVLKGVGVPLEGLALIIGVDQVLERFRAMLNVTGDLVTSVVMERLSGDVESYETEIHEEQVLEGQRHASGEDVVLKPV